MTATVESDEEKREILSHVGVRAILARLKGALTFSQEERYSKDLLLERAIHHASDEDLHFLLQAGRNKLVEKTERSGQTPSRKRKRAEESSTWRTAQRVEEVGTNPTDINDDDYEPEKFLVLPTKQELKDCYAQFYRATSNAALRSGICSVCAQECSFITDQLKDIPLSQLPNSNHLIPTKPHSAHQLFDGRLLEPAGVRLVHNQSTISVCHSCLEDLKKTSMKPPKYSLANQLWIGPTPWQLQVLTFPEQLLVALLYPRVYVFKLFPKRSQGTRNISGLQRAM